MLRLTLMLAAACLAASCATPPERANAPASVAAAPDMPDLLRLTTQRSIIVRGKKLSYRVEIDEHVLRSGDGTPAATETTYTYLLNGAAAAEYRPVIFIYNGGPGSASVWQHLGFYGPRRLKLADAVHPPLTPPFALEDNPHTLLDIADIVFIDPVGTGYSRLLKPDAAKDYYGVDQDAVAMAQVIEAWLTRYQRWNSPKFVAGESYGATRSAVLAHNLMGGPLSPVGRMMGISLNGIVVLGPALGRGDDASTKPGMVTLPSAAATAWYFKLAGQGETLDAFMQRVLAFQRDEYAPALANTNLDAAAKWALATKYAEFTGLPRDVVEKANLQPTLESVRANMLKAKGLRLGSYDARYTLPISDGLGPPDPVTDDPAMGQYSPAFIAGFQLYMEELGLKLSRPYDAIAWDGVNFKWDYTPTGRGPKTPLQALTSAMNRNQDLRVFIGVGWHDFVTTAASADAMAQALGAPDRVTVKKYASGHMPYLGEESATQLEADIRAFITVRAKPVGG
ncbi:MAG TPA: septum formation initiator [Hyphomonadaceae bacterium]|jgi:carboxypeptidase C (cathepsin A)|nr:septum formation initiator [Hyphomonadaceae bacterium]